MRDEMVVAYKKGWQLIPLRPDSKKPNLPVGHKFLSEKATKEDYKGFDFHNYGIVCGALSGITVVDVDFPQGLENIRDAGVELESVETPQVFTPNGRHLFFRYDHEVSTGVGIMGRGVDVRNDGSYVVGAGSKVGGEVYVWHEIYGPDVPLAPVPSWLKDSRRESAATDRSMAEKLGPGERNMKLFSLACALVMRELPGELVYQCIEIINKEWTIDPLDKEELLKIVESANSYRAKKEYEQERW